ncbi:MAG: hypothetical protein IPK13_21355 [Deltaproteobacteria bacterium]|nr:hypothetical protein [Deltaproteobacteria bacterium]
MSAKHHRIIAEAHTTFGPLSGDDPRDSSLKVLPSPGSSSASRSVVIRRAFKPTPIQPPPPPKPQRPTPQVVSSSEARAHQIAYALTQMEDLDIPHDIAPKRNQRIIVTEPLVRSRRRRRVETDHLFTGTDIAIEQCGIHTKISATKIIELDPNSRSSRAKIAPPHDRSTSRASPTSRIRTTSSLLCRLKQWCLRFLTWQDHGGPRSPDSRG